MNSLVETLNRLGGHFLNFAWPMLWQSSLLIALIWATDLALARKIRASVRHALWLVVLVKLLLPPTLALPTGAAWWLFPAQPPAPAPTTKSFTVTFDNPAALQAFISPSVRFVPPPPKLDRAGWTLLAAVAISAGLLGWLLCRWAQVVRMVRRAAPAAEFSQLMAEARRLAGLHGPVRVRTVASPMSPAVCGLFRPVILLPRALAERLSAEQLRAVLLHEVMHLRRRDIWVNCAQSLLQVLYWWHPLVWVANARLRRVREEAVDDAVMLALEANAEIYAPTLLEVARLALRRPLLSLGLVGILESRSALRQRVERLMTCQPPRRAGLTLASLSGIFLFSAVALPMGEAPARVEKETTPASAISASTEATQRTNLPTVIVTAEIYQIPAEDLKSLVSELTFNHSQANEDAWWSASPAAFSNLLSQLKKSGLTPLLRPRIQTSSGKEADFFVSNDKHGIGTELDCLPVVADGQVSLTLHGKMVDAPAAGGATNPFQVNASMPNHGGLVLRVPNDPSNVVVCLNVEVLTNPSAVRFQSRPMPGTKPQSAGTDSSPPVFTGPGRHAIMAKLDTIHFEKVSYDGLPLTEVLKQLSQQCRMRDPEGKGVNFLINPHTVLSGLNPNPAMTPTAGGAASDGPEVDIGSFIVNLPGLTDVRLADVLDAIVLVADHPIKYSIRDFAIVFSARDPQTPQQFARTFRVDPNTFYSGLDQASATSFGAVQNSGSGQNQNNGAVVGVVNAFPGAGGLRNTGQGAGGGGQGSGSLLNNTPTDGAGRMPQATSVSEPARPAAMTFRLNDPKPEAELKTLLSEAGVKMPPTTFIYNAKAGVFAVHGAPDQLALVHRLVLKLNGYSPQEIQSHELSFEKSPHPFPPAIEASTNLFARTFRVDPKTFLSNLESVSTQSPGDAQNNRGVRQDTSGPADLTTQTSSSSPGELARDFFAKFGVDLTNPLGKSIFYNNGMGYLFVKATQSDLDTIERAMQVLDEVPPQIHLKARFWEVPKGTLQDLGQYLNATDSEGQPMGVLTSQQAAAVRQALQSRQGLQVLGEPEITMLVGRQAKMRATQTQVVTNLMWQAVETNQSGGLQQNQALPQTGTLETGPALEAVPHLLGDGYTISLSTMASLTEFLGYAVLDKSGWQLIGPHSLSEEKDVPRIQPLAQVRSQTAKANLYDNQTLVLFLNQAQAKPIQYSTPDNDQGAAAAQAMQAAQAKKGEKEVLVFITSTLVDAAGRRVYSEEEMPFARVGIPPQPPLSPQQRKEPRPGQ